jgi:hypothetical protein
LAHSDSFSVLTRSSWEDPGPPRPLAAAAADKVPSPLVGLGLGLIVYFVSSVPILRPATKQIFFLWTDDCTDCEPVLGRNEEVDSTPWIFPALLTLLSKVSPMAKSG